MIIAKRMTVFQKSGPRVDYTHVQKIETKHEDEFGHVLFIQAEGEDGFGGRTMVYDKFIINDLNHTYIDWYISKT